jgi:ATP-binding cassette subfamily F protein uup
MLDGDWSSDVCSSDLLLLNYDGTLFLVSHDRAFLDNVVTSCLAFEGDGMVQEYIGGYSDWLRQRAEVPVPVAKDNKPAKAEAPAAESRKAAGKKLSFKDQRELEQLPARIEQLEKEQADTQARLADPELYKRDPAAMKQLSTRLKEIEAELAAVYARWEQLEAQRGG